MTYTPYDDTHTVTRGPSPTRNGYDTSAWDLYRQGVEISTDRFRFMGLQPKFWSGQTNGFTEVVTYGQSPGVIDSNPLELESKFEDLPRFNPAAYIQLGNAYPLPIVFNDGPSEQLEATIEPITIPFKKHSNEGPFYAHAIRANLENGNFNGGSTNVVEQFTELAPVSNGQFFLDEGADYFGNIPLDPYIAGVATAITPYDDTLPNEIPNNFTSILNPQDDDNILPYGKKSCSAGGSYYGPNAASYGTDSITFAGWSMGS